MRILHRPRPQIDFRQLIIFPIPGEEFLRCPGLQHEVDRLTPARALVHRGYAVTDIGVATQPERHARHQSPAADAIEHRIFLGDADRRRGGGERRPELHDRDVVQALIARHPRQDGAEQVGIAHEPIGVLVVLVGADAIEADLGRQHKFIDRPIVEVGHLVGIAILPPRRIDPGRGQTVRKIFRQIAIRHEMKTRDLHGHRPPFCSRDIPPPPVAGQRPFCLPDLTREPANPQAPFASAAREFGRSRP